MGGVAPNMIQSLRKGAARRYAPMPGLILAAALLAAAMPAPAAETGDGTMTPQAFEKSVSDAGGRVDFIFEEDRPFAQCHASTVVEAADGSLLAAWFGGTKEKNPDVGIWYARFTENTWTPVKQAAKVNQTAHWNPVLFRDEHGKVHLFFKVGPEIDDWQTYWMHTEDAGTTWSTPEELVKGDFGGRGPVKNKAILLSNKTWLAPASTEKMLWKPFADWSTDGGKTWTRSKNWKINMKELGGTGAIQPTFWESSPGVVHALMRSNGGKIWRADSKDYGKTWSEVYATDLPNNNSGIDVLGLDDGRLLLVYNPVSTNWGARNPLDLALSTDNGKTFRSIAHLEHDIVEGDDKGGEYSYPAIVKTKAGIAVTYTWRRQRVRCWQIPMAAIPEK